MIPQQITDGISVIPGRARISSIDVHHSTPDFLAVEIDMLSKYIDPIVSYGGSGPTKVFLHAGEHALQLDPQATGKTTLVLPPHTAGWEVIATGGRYTIQIAAWRRPEEFS